MSNYVNSNVNDLADSAVGFEQEAKHFIVNGESIEDAKKREQVIDFNKAVADKVKSFEDYNKKLENHAKWMAENVNGIELMPVYGYLIVKPFENNPFQQIQVSESGFITDLGGMAPEYKSDDDGSWNVAAQSIICAAVLEVGPDAKFCEPGDVVFYLAGGACEIPFYKQNYQCVHENRILAVVNSGLSERKAKLKC